MLMPGKIFIDTNIIIYSLGPTSTELPRKLEPFLAVVKDDGDNRHGSAFFAEDVLFPHCGAIGEDLYQSDFIRGRFMLKR